MAISMHNSKSFPSPNPADITPSQRSTILLTGSTGNLGAHILDLLLCDPKVSRVYCFNRSANARERQIKTQADRGFDTALPEDRVSFLRADFGAPYLGLQKEIYDGLRREVDIVIHNAWPVDFNRSFQSFTPHIEGVKSFIEFATPPTASSESVHVEKQVKLLFISSIGVATAWATSAPTSRSKIPEEELTEWKIARTGYGQSKLVCERLLAHASRTIGIPTSIVRVGQLAGPVSEPSASRSCWPVQEWLPSLILSCGALGALPATLGPAESADWVPVDICAHVVGDLAGELAARRLEATRNGVKGKAVKEARFFHIINPQPVQYAHLLPTIRAFFPAETKVVRFKDWVDLLRERRGNVEDVAAAKLLDWFENLQDKAIRFPDARSPVYETKGTVAVSPTLRDLRGVSKEWMSLWMRQWGFGETSRDSARSTQVSAQL